MEFEWKETTLGNVLTLQRGFDLPVQDRVPGHIPVVASNGVVGWHNRTPVAGPGVTIGRSRSIVVSQFLVDDFWPLNTTLWVNDFNGNDPYFCFALLQSIYFQQFNAGSGVLTLNRNHVHPITVRVPVLLEQKAISAVLCSLDDRIDHNRALAANLEAIARRLFKSWFVDFDPVRAKAAGEKHHCLADDIDALFPDRFVESKLGEIPEGWKVEKISGFSLNVRVGCTPSQFSADDFYVGLEHFDRRCLTLWNGGSGDDVTSNKSRFAKGDLLFGKLHPYFHKVAIAPKDGICSTDILVIQCADIAYREFMYFSLFQDDVIQLVSNASGGTRMPRTNWETLAGYNCVVPPKSVSSAFSEIVSPMIETMMQCVSDNSALTKLRNLLLPRLISGRLRVEDAESLVEEAIV